MHSQPKPTHPGPGRGCQHGTPPSRTRRRLLGTESPCAFPSPRGTLRQAEGTFGVPPTSHRVGAPGALPRPPTLGSGTAGERGRERRGEEGPAALLPSVTLPRVPQAGCLEDSGPWRLEPGGPGGGPCRAGVFSPEGGAGGRQAGWSGVGLGAGDPPGERSGRHGARGAAGGGARAAGPGGWGRRPGRGRGVRPGAGWGLTCSKAQLSATRLALRSSSGSGRPRRAPVPGSSPAGQPRLRLAAGGSIRPGRPGDAAPLRLFTTMKPSPRPLPPQPKPRPRRPTSPPPLAACADPPPGSHRSFGIRHVSRFDAIQ